VKHKFLDSSLRLDVNIELKGSILFPELIRVGIWDKIPLKDKIILFENYSKWKTLTTTLKNRNLENKRKDILINISIPINKSKKKIHWDQAREKKYDTINKSYIDVVLFSIYNILCATEFYEIRSDLQDSFKFISNNSTPFIKGIEPAWRYYQYVRPGYLKEGFNYPVDVINLISKISFFDQKVFVHKFFGEKLKTVESLIPSEDYENIKNELKKFGLKDKKTGKEKILFGAFVPRYIEAESSLSGHALGIAIDINYTTNPFIIGNFASCVDDILDYLEKQDNMSRFGRTRQKLNNIMGNQELKIDESLREMSKALQRFLQVWIPKLESGKYDHQATPIRLVKNLINSYKNGFQGVKDLCKNGFITIPSAIFGAMKDAGIKSGIEYKTKKDTMHFEIKPKDIRHYG
jgi:hypothetical protein